MKEIKYKSYSKSTHIRRFFVYLVLVILALICLVPIWMVIVNATRSNAQINNGISFIPSKYLVQNYKKMIGTGVNLTRGFKNSFIISGLSTILNVYFSILTAYAIQVYNFRLKKIFQRFIYILVMIPGQISVVGFYKYMSNIGLINSYIPLIIPAIAAPTGVFFAKQYLEAIVVKDLIASARIDGCTEIGIFHRIILPIARPGMFTLAIFSFTASWNNLLMPFMIISENKKATLPMMVRQISTDSYKTDFGALYIGLAITIVPIVIVFCIMAKSIVSGVTMGAVKE